ncbi:MAG TPA: class I SAM-dependent methyltransferase [Bacteroidia bacterium]|nr:class I SAM-dependent methyltransferase [Bacteroidia bacterium]
MKAFDRYLQRKRIEQTLSFITTGNKVLDIGSNYGELFEFYRKKNTPIKGVGIDPNIEGDSAGNGFTLIKDYFPTQKLTEEGFDAITMLAVLEHIPMDQIPEFAKNCNRKLKQGGKLVITVPSKTVDHILKMLLFLKLIEGMELEQHYGYDINMTQPVFEKQGFKQLVHKTFQLGLNNVFVFEKVASV